MNLNRSRSFFLAGAWMLSTFGSAGALWAGNETLIHPNLSRGHLEGHRYDEGDLGAVDLFNGNLHLSMPLGKRYPVDARLDYGIELHYNSQIWDFDPATQGDGEPMASSNAGLGFDLSFGRLVEPSRSADPWLYVAPDGSAHRFFSALHVDTPDAADPADQVQYSRDGTYLRLTHLSQASKLLERPDGTAHRFLDVQGEWRVDRITAADGTHAVDIAYGAGDLLWTVSDSHGRVQKIFFIADPASPGRRLVDRVELAAFGGATAVYQMGYAQAAIPRPCSDARGGTVTVSLLTSLTDPLGDIRTLTYFGAADGCSKGGRLEKARLESGGFERWDYGPYTFPNAACEDGAPLFLQEAPGVTQRQRMAPDGSIHGIWTYSPEHTAGAGCAVDERRTVVTSPLGDRSVYYFGAGGDGASAGAAADYGLPVSDLQADVAESSPSQRLALAIETFDCDPGGGSCQLVRSQWEAWTQDERCATSAGHCFETQRRLERRRFVYHDDVPLGGADRFKNISYANFDGLGHYRSVTRTSNFGRADQLTTFRDINPGGGTYTPGASPGPGPGLGIGTFTVPAPSAPWLLGDAALVHTQDDAGHGSYRDLCFDAFGRKVRERRRGATPSAHDLVTTFTWSTGQIVSTAFYGGDRQTLSSHADLCSMPLPPSPTYRRADSFQFGVLASSTWLEPDGTPMPYAMRDRDIDASTGLVAAKRDTAGLEIDFLYDLLGRLTWERPESGHGAWKHIVHHAPRLDQPTQNVGPARYIFHRPNGQPTGPVLAQRFEQEDAFGRLSMERGWTGSGQQNRRRLLRYDAFDHLIKETPWHYVGDTFVWSERQDFDPFGRVRRLLPPEGASHEVLIEYRGVRESVKTERAEKEYRALDEQCLEADLVTTSTLDGLGRLWKTRLERPDPWPGEVVEMERHYLPGDEPVLLQEKRTVNGVHSLTRKVWTYDDRGLLTSTEHFSGTESTVEPTLTLSFSDYDARGLHHGESRSGALHAPAGTGSIRSYDAAGRLIQVADADTPTRLWKELVYATANGVPDAQGRPDLRLGKLQRAVRHNYTRVNLPAHHTVEEERVYRGLGGRLSEATTTVATVSQLSSFFDLSRAWGTSQTYDELGRVATLTYPSCLQCAAGEPTEERQVSFTYDWLGRETSVSGTWDGSAQDWVSAATWAAGDLPAEIVHANGVRDVITADGDGHDRPGRIEVLGAGAATLFDSGTMVYDGRGDICGQGARAFVSVPDEIEVLGDDVPTCVGLLVVDPFGRWNGETEDPATCSLDLGLQSYTLYDPWDRVVGALDLAVWTSVEVGGVTQWIRDPDSYTHTWMHFGLDGKRLRQVRTHYQGAWQQLYDYVYGLDASLGMARVQPFTGNTSEQRHRHPLMRSQTTPQGWVMNPWN